MNERELASKWLRKYKKDNPDAFVYRIVDSPVSRRPFDAFILQESVFTAIEFKMDGNSLLAHQEDELENVKASGGKARYIVFRKDGTIIEDRYL